MKKESPLLFIIPSRKISQAEMIEANGENQEPIIFGDEIESTLLSDYQIPVQDINLLQQLGFSGNDVQVSKDSNLATKENYINYILKGDIKIKADNLVNMAYL